MKNKTTKEEKSGNNILNGIERWIPDGTERPSQFKYESPDRIWYKSIQEAGTCLGRAGIPEANWIPVPPKFAEESEVR